MILYELRCANGHNFEAWFRDSAAYDTQAIKEMYAQGDDDATAGTDADGDGVPEPGAGRGQGHHRRRREPEPSSVHGQHRSRVPPWFTSEHGLCLRSAPCTA